jgi:hypothetical protein
MTKLIIKLMIKLMNRKKHQRINTVHRLPVSECVRVRVGACACVCVCAPSLNPRSSAHQNTTTHNLSHAHTHTRTQPIIIASGLPNQLSFSPPSHPSDLLFRSTYLLA